MRRFLALGIGALLLGVSLVRPAPGIAQQAVAGGEGLLLPGEKHFKNIRQLTFGGENAEAYFSADSKKLIFQSTREGVECDQIFEMNVDGTGLKMLSTSKGRTTCSYF